MAITDQPNANQFLPDVPINGIPFPVQDFLIEVKTRLEALYQDPDPPAQPTNFTATADVLGIHLQWDKALKAAGYRVLRADLGQGFSAAQVIVELRGSGNISFFDPFQNAAATYTRTYWVIAVSQAGVTSVPSQQQKVSNAQFAVDGASILPGSITTTEIADNAISTPKLQANSVVAAKISVAVLSAISADLGSITAGTITGAVIQTATSGQRVILDSLNGIRLLDSGNNLLAQLPLIGAAMLANLIAPSGGVAATDAVTLTNGDQTALVVCRHDVTLRPSANRSCIVELNSGTTKLSTTNLGNGNELFAVDCTDGSATQTPAKLLLNGTTFRVTVDNSDLGSGTKKYLYLA